MGGPSNGSGSSDAPNTTKSRVTKVRSQTPIRDFILSGGITGAVVRGVTGAIKKSKTKKEANVEMGLGTDRMSNYSIGQGGTRKEGGDNDIPTMTTITNKKSIEQPKVKSQLSNTEIKSGLIVADKIAPTEVEMTAEEKLVARKRGKKTKTILSSVTGDNSKATLSKKTLLG